MSTKFNFIRNGNLVLIEVAPTIWKIPAVHLCWAKAQWPVYAKLLPSRKGETIPRYALYKGEIAFHRIYMHAEPGEQVAASDGDFTNFGFVLARVRIQHPMVDGLVYGPGIFDPNNPVRVESERFVPNLYLVASPDNPHARTQRTQNDFEKNFLQPVYRNGSNEQVEKLLKVRVNDDVGLMAGTPAGPKPPGKFVPISALEHEEHTDLGVASIPAIELAHNLNAEANDIRRAWLRNRPPRLRFG
jgi:hypothetical protein